MRCVIQPAAFTVVLVLFATSHAAGQTAIPDFTMLADQLKRGDRIVVTDAQGREITGRLDVLSATSMTIVTDGKREQIEAENVRAIDESADALWNGALIGAAAVAPGAYICYKLCDNFGVKGVIGELTFATVLGVIIDKVYDRTPVYRANVSRAALVPVLDRSRAALFMSWEFGARRP